MSIKYNWFKNGLKNGINTKAYNFKNNYKAIGIKGGKITS